MTIVETRMTKETRSSNDEEMRLRTSGFVIRIFFLQQQRLIAHALPAGSPLRGGQPEDRLQ